MWELIRANKRKSTILVICMGFVLILLGGAIGGAATGTGGGALTGMMIAAVVWFFLTLTAYKGGGSLLMQMSKAKPIEKKDHPLLYNVVEEMTIAAGFSKIPKIYIIDDMALNAFATGRDSNNCAVAVTAGLLGKLNRDELQGVIAHEMSHIQNRDILFMTMLGIMLGAIVIVSEVFLRSLWYSGGSRRSRNSSSKDSGGGAILMIVLAIIFAIIAPLLAYIIYYASSRRREYLADAGGAMLTRYPEGLASALQAISRGKPMKDVSKAMAPMYIANPLKMKASGMGSTHPPIKERIRILRSMGGNLSFSAYQEAWSKIGGKNAGALPASLLKSGGQVEARAANPDAEKRDTRKQMRQASDILRKANKFAFIACACGLRLKLPPEFKQTSVKCPRCSRDLKVPVAQMAAMKTVADVMDKQGKLPGSK